MDARVLSLQHPRGTPVLAMVAKRAYRLTGGQLVATTATAELHTEPTYAPSTNPGALERLTADSDLFAPLKPSTDVVVRGAAYSTRGPVRTLDTHVQIGPLRKTVRACGRRVIRLDAAGRPRFSEPESFESVPIVWDHAYGGRDAYAEEQLDAGYKGLREHTPRGALVYPRNPSGRGFILDLARERIAGTEAPRLEDPADAVTPDRLLARSALDWPDRPAAACYEPVDWMAFPRVALWLGVEREPSTRPLYERRLGVLREEDLAERAIGSAPDPRAFNCAPAGLCGARLAGGELVRLWNLHPHREQIEFALPGERPKLLLEPPGCNVYELPALLATVLIEPAAERVTLTWTGVLEVAAPYPQRACEAMRYAVRWER